MSTDIRRLEIQRYLTGDLGYDSRAASRVALATMPLDDGRPAGHGFEAEVRKLAREFSARSKGQELWQVDRMAMDTLGAMRSLAEEYGETYYARRYEQALAARSVASEPVAEPPSEPEPPPVELPYQAGRPGAPGVVLRAATKTYGEVVAVDAISLEIADGEFFSLLGPSGCGKTTTLRMIAGFEQPDSGRILLGEHDVTDLPPHRRPVNTVFQSYALFPHLTVGDNVAFGLRFQRATKDEGRRRVAAALELVRLEGFERRRPHQLSGGQQQRVALARALVLEPRVLLLDEPLGALDAKLRRALQLELKTIQREVGITFVYVTHDQEEALTMSDRLAVMNAGRLEQLGSPRQVYEEPATAFVADFLGISNLLEGRCDGLGLVRFGGIELVAGAGATTVQGPVRITIRPERVELEPAGSSGQNRVDALVDRLVYVGPITQVQLTLAGGASLQALVANGAQAPVLAQGQAVAAYLPADAVRVLADASSANGSAETGQLAEA